jgi:hypothetical protein
MLQKDSTELTDEEIKKRVMAGFGLYQVIETHTVLVT